VKRLFTIGAVLIVLAVIGAVAMVKSTPTIELETMDYTPPELEQTGMCPWRNPDSDMRAFFPGATGHKTMLMSLSDLSLKIKQRVGKSTELQTNGLYVYPIVDGNAALGTVLIQRFAAPHGAMEAVVGVANDGKIAGVRIQRLREPPSVARELTSEKWLGAFRGLTASSAFKISGDLPRTRPESRDSAAALAEAVRVLMIEFDLGKANLSSSAHAGHHE
jgi:hypothetical protein